MIIFDRINYKDKKLSRLPEETRIQDERRKLIDPDQCKVNSIPEKINEVFGIGLESSENKSIDEPKTSQDDVSGHTCWINRAAAIDILTSAQVKMATFQSLISINESATEISYRHFPYLNTALTLFYNSEFNFDRDVDEHDERIDNILKSRSMSRVRIAKDGDCCFRAVARNIFRLTENKELSTNEHLANLGLLDLSEEILTSRLRALTVSEWSGDNRQQYEHFLTADKFEEEIERFKHQGHFTGELGNLMVLAMANILKMPIVIFSSLENYPTIPILPRQQLSGTPTLFVSFNATGCGHYDYVHMEHITSESENQPSKEINEKETPDTACSCGVSKKGVGSLQNICNNVPGSYSSRCKCLKARVCCGKFCRCKGCSNPYGNRQACASVAECAPRKRRKFDFQGSAKLNSQAYLTTKGEPLREGALTEEEFFVVEELIKAGGTDGKKELTSTSLLECYTFVQSISNTLEPKPLLLRSKTQDQIKKALAAHNHNAAVMAALFKKQVELCYSKPLKQ